jgi:hypothetical protein
MPGILGKTNHMTSKDDIRALINEWPKHEYLQDVLKAINMPNHRYLRLASFIRKIDPNLLPQKTKYLSGRTQSLKKLIEEVVTELKPVSS